MVDFPDILDQLTEELIDLSRHRVPPDSLDRASHGFFDLYLAYRRGLDRMDSAELEKFLHSTVRLMKRSLPQLNAHLNSHIEDTLSLSLDGPDWVEACRMRTTLEGIKELYGPHLPVARLVPDPDELDDMMRVVCEDVPSSGREQAQFPLSHWWWDAA
ncbi:MAG: hypothetical protein AB8B51_18560 [Sedimentitalea sp.]